MSDPVTSISDELAGVDLAGSESQGAQEGDKSDVDAQETTESGWDEEELVFDDYRITAIRNWFDIINGLMEGKVPAKMERARKISAAFIDNITPVIDDEDGQVLYGPSMVLTAYAMNQYAWICFNLRDLTVAERYARFAISILDDRLASPINDYDNAKDVQFLTETYDDATNTLESIAKIVRCSPAQLTKLGVTYDAEKASKPIKDELLKCPPLHEWPALRRQFDRDVAAEIKRQDDAKLLQDKAEAAAVVAAFAAAKAAAKVAVATKKREKKRAKSKRQAKKRTADATKAAESNVEMKDAAGGASAKIVGAARGSGDGKEAEETMDNPDSGRREVATASEKD